MSRLTHVSVALVASVVVLAFGVAGCGSNSGNGGEPESFLPAGNIGDGAKPMNPQQIDCPVCGQSIDPKIHTKSEKKRVYFDSKNCLKKYTQNPDTYREKVMQQGMAPPSPGG
jgi:YHS domain-containing protein